MVGVRSWAGRTDGSSNSLIQIPEAPGHENMQLNSLDWALVIAYFSIVVVFGLWYARRAGKGLAEFFVSGRSLPWWMLGTSMVATTFSTDTPNLVTDIVRKNGVAGNWTWWAFLITGMGTVFLYSRLWRRSEVLTDVGFYELRYSGKGARFLRGFRALYLGLFFNVVIMASVTLAAIKISGVLLGVDKYTTVIVCGVITAAYSATSGLWGVVLTDCVLFVLAMAGSITAAVYALQHPEVGGLTGLLTHAAVIEKTAFLPDFSDWNTALVVLIIPLAVQWWSTWYPGAEPGGGSYIAQRMLAARDERHSLLATLWFNIAHYGLRPWPWLLVALASLVVFPDLDSLRLAFPDLDPSILQDDLAYPAMLTFLPHGLLGLVVASLAAAYMSTISTQVNLGASYLVNDLYRRFLKPEASNRHYIQIARLITVSLVVLAGLVSFWLENALQAFNILLQIGAGTGLIFLLRWFWWRINAWSEISGMVASFSVAVYFEFIHESLGLAPIAPQWQLVTGVVLTTISWISVTLLTPPCDHATLEAFVLKVRPFSRGWRPILGGRKIKTSSLSASILSWFAGVAAVYSALFGTGFLLYRNLLPATCLFIIFALSASLLWKLLPQTLEDRPSA